MEIDFLIDELESKVQILERKIGLQANDTNIPLQKTGENS